MNGYAILYSRPDGWWIAGSGWEDETDAAVAAGEQLPDHVQWKVVGEDSDDYAAAVALEKANE